MALVRVLILGPDTLTQPKAREIIRSHLSPEEEPLGLEIVDLSARSATALAEGLGAAIRALRTYPPPGHRRAVWLRSAAFLAETKSPVSKAVADLVRQLAEEIRDPASPASCVVATAPDIAARFSKLRETFEGGGTVILLGVSGKPWEQEREVRRRIDEALRAARLEAKFSAVQALADRIGTDIGRLPVEVEKLRLHAAPRTEVTVADVEAVVSRGGEASVWDWTDAVSSGGRTQALVTLRRLLEPGESEIRLAAQLSSRFRDLDLYREAIDAGWLIPGPADRSGQPTWRWATVPASLETAIREGWMSDPRQTHPYRVTVLARQAARWNAEAIWRCRRIVLETQERLVSSRIPPAMVLELALVQILNGFPAGAPAETGEKQPFPQGGNASSPTRPGAGDSSSRTSKQTNQ